MAVCGRCEICGDKFDCVENQSCGCVGRKPLRLERVDGSAYSSDPHVTDNPRICGRCEDLIKSGALGSLVAALRAAKP